MTHSSTAEEQLNERVPGSVLVMHQRLRSEPYDRIKAIGLFMNSYFHPRLASPVVVRKGSKGRQCDSSVSE